MSGDAIDPTRLHGTWELAEFIIGFDDGRPPLHPFGDDARGLLIYAPDGHLSALLCKAHRPRIGARLETADRAPVEARATAFDGYLSYAGRWTLEGDEVVHRVDFALVPDVVGTENRRRVHVDGDRLVLSYDVTPKGGGLRHYRLTWRRPA